MRILVIEDNKAIAEFLKNSLEEERYVVDTAFDGERGLFLARSNVYDAAIIDLILPKLDGHAVCSEIRAAGKLLPILILSVRSEIPDKVSLLRSGADDYMVKPFSFAELSMRLHVLLRRPREMRRDLLMVDDLELDSVARSVQRDGRDIVLTRKEFMMLEYLMRHAGRVISRSELVEHVWDQRGDAFSNTVETHVLNLRRKLNFGDKKKLIVTISGSGYKIM